MKRALSIAMVMLIAGLASAQDAAKILETFKRNFAIASIEVKIQILQDAASNPNVKELGPLFHLAIDFVLDNISIVDTDARFNQLGALAVEQIGSISYAPARASVLRLFLEDTDTDIRTRSVTALGEIGAGDAEVIANLTSFLDRQNSLFASGTIGPDITVIPSLAKVLGKLGDPASFGVLFTAMNLGYSAQISEVAKGALAAIKGDLRQMITDLIRASPPAEKKLALSMALESTRLSPQEKAQVAEFALDVGLHAPAADSASKEPLRQLRYQAAGALGAFAWPKATGLLIENLDMAIMEVDRGLSDRSRLLEAVAALGSMATHEAAVRLTQYMMAMNSYTEKGKGYDEQVVGAVVDNLGKLGDKVAFDDLMYAQYLDYSNTIKKAARAAINKLKW